MKMRDIMNTITLLKRDGIRVVDNQIEHRRKLMDLQEIKGWQRIKLDLLDAGFYYYITARKLCQFKYYAVVRDRIYKSNYRGDIPEFAIDRANLAMSLGIVNITIHSNEPLPVKQQKGDPVMVGWLRKPQAGYNGEFAFLNSENSLEGVVIAIWDNDKELELNEG